MSSVIGSHSIFFKQKTAYEMANTVSWMPRNRSWANITRSATVFTATAWGEVICGLAVGSNEFWKVMPYAENPLPATDTVALQSVPYWLPLGAIVPCAMSSTIVTSAGLPVAPSRVMSGLAAGT